MSLHAPWTSTLFGGFYFIGNLYLGLAVVIILSICANRSRELSPRLVHNLGKLLFSFSLLWTYLFWSQYLVIWYGNLPREIDFVLLRTSQHPWNALAIVILVMNFLIPFIVLMPRSSKENRKVLLAVAIIVVVGMWLERFLLVMPSLTSGTQIPLGWAEILMTVGFFASFVLVYLSIFSRIPIFSTAESSSRH
jgi:Ni/Fe-hydrogenase subunit HybB-like protein